MGYTHYWKHTQEFTAQEWAKIQGNFLTLLDACPVKICGGLGKDVPEVTDDRIWFNGCEDLGEACETFCINRTLKRDWNSWFCKTQYQPYDLLVCATLLLVSSIAPDKFSFTSDGDSYDGEWTDALEFANKILESDFADFMPETEDRK